MNRLKTTDNGGFPLELDDLRWQEEAVRDAFKGLTSFLERDNIILSGVAISGLGTANTTWTEGYVLINGEVCKVDAPTIPLNTVNQAFSTYIEVVVEYDANGLETFENNVAYDTYEKRKATITTYATAQPGKTHYIGFATVKDVINTFILNYTHRFTACQSWAQGTSVAIAPNQNLIPVDNGSGNVFNINIDNALQTMVGTSTTFPNGTWLAFKFTGNANSQIKIGDNNTEFKTPQGKTFVFRAGEIAHFIQLDGKLHLVNGFRIPDEWITVSAFASGWLPSPLPVKYFKNELDEVSIIGAVSSNTYTTAENELVFTLPLGYRPQQRAVIRTWDFTQDVYSSIQIETDGRLLYFVKGLHNDHTVTINFDGHTRFKAA
ncbi:MAG TPA: hypothetical protein VK154_10205 [Chitinophagales bacterium]|nr:hypothetical protein [Chitinophagales bacterium]